MIARFGMLQCGKNYKGTMNELCGECNDTDNEDHRVNYCKLYKDINLCNTTCKINFDDIYSHDLNIVRRILPIIERTWNTKTAHGVMNQ